MALLPNDSGKTISAEELVCQATASNSLSFLYFCSIGGSHGAWFALQEKREATIKELAGPGTGWVDCPSRKVRARACVCLCVREGGHEGGHEGVHAGGHEGGREVMRS